MLPAHHDDQHAESEKSNPGVYMQSRRLITSSFVVEEHEVVGVWNADEAWPLCDPSAGRRLNDLSLSHELPRTKCQGYR